MNELETLSADFTRRRTAAAMGWAPSPREAGPGTLEGIQTIDEDGLLDFTVTAAPTFGRALEARVIEHATGGRVQKQREDGTWAWVPGATAFRVLLRGHKVYGSEDPGRAMAYAVRTASKHLKNYAVPRGIDERYWASAKDLAAELGTTTARINREGRRARAERASFGYSHLPTPVVSSNLRDYYPREVTLQVLKVILNGEAKRAA